MNELPEDGTTPKDFELARRAMLRVAPLKAARNGEKSYRIHADGKTITCLFCGRESHHPDDVRHGYCANCDIFHLPG